MGEQSEEERGEASGATGGSNSTRLTTTAQTTTGTTTPDSIPRISQPRSPSHSLSIASVPKISPKSQVKKKDKQSQKDRGKKPTSKKERRRKRQGSGDKDGTFLSSPPAASSTPPEFRTKPIYVEKTDDNTAIIRGMFGWLADEHDWINRKKAKDRFGPTSNLLNSTSNEPRSPVASLTDNDTKATDTAKGNVVFSLIRKRLRRVAEYLRIGCCPPWPPRIVRRAMFPAPPSTYGFVAGKDEQVTPANRDSFPLDMRFRVDYNMVGKCNQRLSRLFEGLGLYELQGFFAENALGARLAGVWLPARHEPPTCTILFSHGNAMDIGHSIPTIYKLRRKLNAQVLAYDYSGYGLSSGKACERSLYADIECMYAWLRKAYGVRGRDVVLYGFSLGSAASAHLAAKEPEIRGLVLAGAFVSGLNVLKGLRCLVDVDRPRPSIDVLKTYQKIPHIQQKTLIVHGVKDELVSIENAIWLVENLSNAVEPCFLLEASHNDLDTKPRLFLSLFNFIVNDLGFPEPYKQLRKSFRELLVHRFKIHPSCTTTNEMCPACRACMAKHLFEPHKLLKVDLPPEKFLCPSDVIWLVEPRSVGQQWAGRFSMAMSQARVSYADVKRGAIPEVPRLSRPPLLAPDTRSDSNTTSQAPK